MMFAGIRGSNSAALTGEITTELLQRSPIADVNNCTTPTLLTLGLGDRFVTPFVYNK
jgi:hypothetical protein